MPKSSRIVESLRRSGLLYAPEPVARTPELEDLFRRFFNAVSDVYAPDVLGQARVAANEVLDGGRNAFAQIASNLYQGLIRSIGDVELRERLSDPTRSVIEVEELGDFNATSFAIGDTWVTLLDRKLIEVLYATSRAVSARVNAAIGTPACEACRSSGCTEVAASVSARRWFEAGWRAEYGSGQIAELWMPTGPQLAYANMLATTAETFVLAHEIGHHVSGHTQHLPVQPDQVERFEPDHTMELEADVSGAALLITHAVVESRVGSDGGLDGSALVAMSLGIEHFFCTAELLQRVSPRQVDTGGRHPSIARRRQVMREALGDDPQLRPLTSFAEDLRCLFASLWDAVASPSSHAIEGHLRDLEVTDRLLSEAFASVARSGPDHLAALAGPLIEARASQSHLVFDSRVAAHARVAGQHGFAARLFSELFCDTPAEVAEHVDVTEPFFGLERYVDTSGMFGEVAPTS